jgi:hypothetical protein
MPMDCPLGVWMIFDPFCELEIEDPKLRWFQWDNSRSGIKTIPMGPRLRSRV